MEIVSLNNSNVNEFKILNSKRSDFNLKNLDFFDYYNNVNFFRKMQCRKYVRILKRSGEYIGYIWEKPLGFNSHKIESLYLDKEYAEKENILKLIGNRNQNYILHYKGSDRTLKILNDIGFIFKNKTLIFKIDLKDKFNDAAWGITFRTLIIGKDEEVRCKIQNEIFNSKGRVPLTMDDIYYDELQKYYFAEGAVFIQLNNNIIGYGQVIIENEKPYIVNFGILDKYKRKGYGRILIHHLLDIIIDEGYNYSLLKVDKGNYPAVNLYKSTGFKEIEENCILELIEK